MHQANSQVMVLLRSLVLGLQLVSLMGPFLFGAVLSAQETEVSVLGTIRDQAGMPVSGATVQFEYLREKDIEQQSMTCLSDEHGRYELPKVTVSSGEDSFHSIRVAKAGFAFSRIVLSRVEYPGGKTIPADGKANVDFSIEASKSFAIQLRNVDGLPVANAVLASLTTRKPLGVGVQLRPSDWKTLELEVPKSNQNGIIKIDCLTSHDIYDFGFEHPDFARTNLWSITPSDEALNATLERGELVTFKVACMSNPTAIKDAKVNLSIFEEGGHSSLDLDVNDQGICVARLADRSTTITVKHPTLFGTPFYDYRPKQNREYKFELFESTKVRGRVIDCETRKGVEGVFVSLAHTKGVVSSAKTDKMGEYELSGPATEVSLFVAFGESEWQLVGEPIKRTLNAGISNVLPDSIVAARKPLRGKVVLPSGGPAVNALVAAGLLDSVLRTDADGNFELRPWGFVDLGVPILAFHPYEELACWVVVDKEAQDVLIELAPEGVLYGIVVDENNKPLPNFRVNLVARISLGGSAHMFPTLGHTYTNEDGTFVFAGLSKGVVYQAAIQGKQKSSFSVQFDLKSKAFQVGSAKDRKVLVVSDDLVAEVNDIARSLPQPPQKLGQLDVSNWFGNRSLTPQDLKGKKVLLCFLSSSEPEPFKQAYELYADKGLILVGIYPTRETREQAEATLQAQGIKFPIAIVDGTSTIETYQVDEQICAVAYGSDGLLVRPIYARRNELLEIRNFVLYGR